MNTPQTQAMIQRAFGEDGNGDDYAAYIIAMEECKKLETQRNELLEALEVIILQADAQFKAGDKHATFNRQTINAIRPAIAKAKGETP